MKMIGIFRGDLIEESELTELGRSSDRQGLIRGKTLHASLTSGKLDNVHGEHPKITESLFAGSCGSERGVMVLKFRCCHCGLLVVSGVSDSVSGN